MLLALEESGVASFDNLVNVGEDAYGVVPGAYVQTNLPLTIAKIIHAGLTVLGIVFLALMVYGGFLYMTSGGNEQVAEKAKKTMTAAVIGLAIILASYSITLFVTKALVKAT